MRRFLGWHGVESHSVRRQRYLITSSTNHAMNQLFPIIRRKRRPLLPVEQPLVEVPAGAATRAHESDKTKATDGTAHKEQQKDEQPPTKIADGESE